MIKRHYFSSSSYLMRRTWPLRLKLSPTKLTFLLDSPPDICFLVTSLWLSGQWWSGGPTPNSACYFLSSPSGSIAKNSVKWGGGTEIRRKGALLLAFICTQWCHKPLRSWVSCRSSFNANAYGFHERYIRGVGVILTWWLPSQSLRICAMTRTAWTWKYDLDSEGMKKGQKCVQKSWG